MRTLRKRRLFLVLMLVSASVFAGYLVVKALDENINFFISPTQIKEGEVQKGARVRIGGVVLKGSVVRDESLTVRFILTDFENQVGIEYLGILPDLFKEGQGIVALGVWDGEGFVADQVLAKHDENYMPPEVKSALR